MNIILRFRIINFIISFFYIFQSFGTVGYWKRDRVGLGRDRVGGIGWEDRVGGRPG